MTREDVVRLWDQANNWGIPIRSELVDELKRFADLARAEEREACAKVCEAEAKKWDDKDIDFMALLCAAAIRARGEK